MEYCLWEEQRVEADFPGWMITVTPGRAVAVRGDERIEERSAAVLRSILEAQRWAAAERRARRS